MQHHDRRLEQEPEFVERTDLLGQAEAPDAEIDDACLGGELLREHGWILFAVVDPGAEGEGIAENNDVRQIVAVGEFRHRDPVAVFVGVVDEAPRAWQLVDDGCGRGQEMPVAFGVTVARIKLRLGKDDAGRKLEKSQCCGDHERQHDGRERKLATPSHLRRRRVHHWQGGSFISDPNDVRQRFPVDAARIDDQPSAPAN